MCTSEPYKSRWRKRCAKIDRSGIFVEWIRQPIARRLNMFEWNGDKKWKCFKVGREKAEE